MSERRLTAAQLSELVATELTRLAAVELTATILLDACDLANVFDLAFRSLSEEEKETVRRARVALALAITPNRKSPTTNGFGLAGTQWDSPPRWTKP